MSNEKRKTHSEKIAGRAARRHSTATTTTGPERLKAKNSQSGFQFESESEAVEVGTRPRATENKGPQLEYLTPLGIALEDEPDQLKPLKVPDLSGLSETPRGQKLGGYPTNGSDEGGRCSEKWRDTATGGGNTRTTEAVKLQKGQRERPPAAATNYKNKNNESNSKQNHSTGHFYNRLFNYYRLRLSWGNA